jgi:alpha-N-acetylglucosaminidase
MFEWLFDYSWDSTAANVSEWISQYARTRAGQTDTIAEKAWHELLNTVYDQQISGVGLGNTIEMRPRFEGTAHYTRRGESYDYGKLADIFGEMLLADSATLENPRYQYDLVMVCRQVLANLEFEVRNKAFEAYKKKDTVLFDEYTSLFLNIASDVDRIVSIQPEFSLDEWVLASHQFEASDAPKSYFEKNAKVLITTWGQQDNFLIDYAARDYSGLINSFYKKRWEIYYDTARICMLENRELDQEKFDKDISEFEWQFCETTYTAEVAEQIDASILTKDLYKKYSVYFDLFDDSTE